MSVEASRPSLEDSLDEFIALLKQKTDETVTAANALPPDIAFHRSLDRKFRADLDKTTERVLKLTNRLLKLAETVSIKPANAGARKKNTELDSDEDALEDEHDVVDKFHSVVVDTMDPLLEHALYSLDVHTGRVKARADVPVVKKEKSKPDTTRLPANVLHANNLVKPQTRFIEPVNNSNDLVWRHTLQQKWHAAQIGSSRPPSSAHPYFKEITSLSHPPSMFLSRPPIPPKSFDDTPFTFVESLNGLHSLLDQLKQSEEIAIDLEYHSYRSYYGFVCLMQVSNRQQDWVVDCLMPEIRANLEILNEVFTDPNIVKVLHGAESDIVWLQENFHLYIVNLFDTFHASRALELPRHSLAFLLSAYCDFTADKRYQLADWRIRPLPAEMLHYARSDTHFLLFIYDQLREALLEKGKNPSTPPAEDAPPLSDPQLRYIRRVLSNSAQTSLREFVRERYDAVEGTGMRGWAGLLKKWNRRSLLVPGVERNIFLAVHAWRDRVAREEDESPVFVISNQLLLSLMDKPVPVNLTALFASFPGSVPSLIRKRGAELLKVMQDAAVAPIDAAKMEPMLLEEDAIIFDATANAITTDLPSHTLPPSQSIVPVVGLWEPTKPPIIAKRSTLFGGKLGDTDSQGAGAKLAVRTSTLFGARLTSARLAESSTDAIRKSIQDIHNSIMNTSKKEVVVQTQSIVKQAPQPKSDPNPPSLEEQPQPAPQPMLAEVEFIPRSQRTIRRQDDDDVVIIGQRKQKRKRNADDSLSDKASSSKRSKLTTAQVESDQGVDSEIAVFDYGAEPNLLDEGALRKEQGNVSFKKERREAQKRDGAKLDFGEFRRAPKKTNEPKSGNKSITYR